jgi:hypothetical protein
MSDTLDLCYCQYELECVKGALASQQELNMRLENQLKESIEHQRQMLNHNVALTKERDELKQQVSDLEASRALANKGAERLAQINNQIRAEFDRLKGKP